MSSLSNIQCIPAFSDNYIWLIQSQGLACVVDPGDAQPVLQQLRSNNLSLHSILITHWHPDHIGGVEALAQQFPNVQIFAPKSAHIPCFTEQVCDGQKLNILNYTFDVMAVPGHTLDHVVYHDRQKQLIFVGDTLFAGGCGRVFEGTHEQMFSSLETLAKLDEDTLIFCAHEYTQANLTFCLAVEGDNPDIKARIKKVDNLRDKALPSVPFYLRDELATNVFLRTETGTPRFIPEPYNKALNSAGSRVEIFTALREWKNNF